MSKRGGRLVLAGLSILLYLASLRPAALYFRVSNGGPRIMTGLDCLFAGLGALLDVGNLGWLANFLFVPSVMLMVGDLRRVSIGLALGEILLALDSLRLFHVRVSANEAGVGYMELQHLGAGFFLWIAAMLVVLVGAVLATSGRRG